MNKYLEKIISLPKSLYVSFRLTGIRNCFRLPILVRYNVVLKSLKGKVIFDGCNPKRGILQVGFNNINVLDKKYQRSIMEIDGKVYIKGFCFWGHGARISIGKGGVLTVGNNFLNNAGMTLICFKRITIGDDVLVSWDTMVMDTDFHSTIDLLSNKVKEKVGEIVIGDKCWLCYGATILKNSCIANGVIVSAKALVNSQFLVENSIIGGIPAKIIKRDIKLYRN